MLDLSQQTSLGGALRAAFARWPRETCLIESDRQRENTRLTYGQFAERGHTLARALQDRGFGAGHRAAIVMTNQSKWLLSAYAIMARGGVLVPLDYKLNGDEHLQLLVHAGADVLMVEYPSRAAFAQMVSDPNFQEVQKDRLDALEETVLIACTPHQ